jgi:hypothetical protein
MAASTVAAAENLKNVYRIVVSFIIRQSFTGIIHRITATTFNGWYTKKTAGKRKLCHVGRRCM